MRAGCPSPPSPLDPIPSSYSSKPRAASGRAPGPTARAGFASPAGEAGGGAQRRRASFPRFRRPVSPAETARRSPPAGRPGRAREDTLGHRHSSGDRAATRWAGGCWLKGQQPGMDPEQGRATARALTLPRTSPSLPRKPDRRGCRGAAGR